MKQHTPNKLEKHMGGLHWSFYFDNGYGASVICHDGSYGGKSGLFEVAVLDKDGVTYDTPVTDNVLDRLTFSEVAQALCEIEAL